MLTGKRIKVTGQMNKTGEIVLYCQIGKRSRTAYRKLKRMNYKNVYCLYGGIDNY